MARKPESPPQPVTWTIYRAAKKAIRLGEVEAMDERGAIETGAREFRQDPAKLFAVQRR